MKMKTIRTMLYGDCEFSDWELELIHTPIMQRMYGIKQLGFTDKVFPDAVHSRLNHVLGVVNRAEKIYNGVYKSLQKESHGILPARKSFKYSNQTISIEELLDHVGNRRTVI